MSKKLFGATFVVWICFPWLTAAAAPTSIPENLKWLSVHPPQERFSFVVLGDNRDGDEIFQKILSQIQKEKEIAFILHLGDMVSPGLDTKYRNFAKLIEPLPYPFFSVMGNHDIYLTGRRNYLKYFGDPVYYFDYSRARFIILDNAENTIGENQFQWLEALLKQSQGKLLFLAIHRPTFNPTHKQKAMSNPQEIERLESLMDRYKVRYAFFGHNHLYARRVIKDRVEIISGGAGSPLYADKAHGGFYHYLRITVNGDQITDQVVPLETSKNNVLQGLDLPIFFRNIACIDKRTVSSETLSGGSSFKELYLF